MKIVRHGALCGWSSNYKTPHQENIGWILFYFMFSNEMIELGLLKLFVGVEFLYLSTYILMCQHAYVASILN